MLFFCVSVGVAGAYRAQSIGTKLTHGDGDGQRWTLNARVSFLDAVPKKPKLGLSPTGARVGCARLTENSAGCIITGETGLAHAGAGRIVSQIFQVAFIVFFIFFGAVL